MTAAHPNASALYAANTRRQRAVGRRRAAEARVALQIIDAHTPYSDIEAELQRRYKVVLLARMLDPDASLAELARSVDMSKDEFSARLRRALAYADRLVDFEGAQA
jgi:hypothetical protein